MVEGPACDSRKLTYGVGASTVERVGKERRWVVGSAGPSEMDRPVGLSGPEEIWALGKRKGERRE
jgi:hypothetical protein